MKSAQRDLFGAATETVATASSARKGRGVTGSRASGATKTRTAQQDASDTVRSGGSVVPRSKRKPCAEERTFLRAFRLFYHRPETFPEESYAVTRAAQVMGWRHPLTSRFRWTND